MTSFGGRVRTRRADRLDRETASRSEKALDALREAARMVYAERFPMPEASFDAPVWDVQHLRTRATSAQNRCLYFTRHGTQDEPLAPHFAAVLKAWIVLEFHSVSNAATRSSAGRLLYEAVLGGRSGEPARFQWPELSAEDFYEAERRMGDVWGHATIYLSAMALVGFAAFLESRGIIGRLHFRPRTQRPEQVHNYTLAGQAERMARMPTAAALSGLAEIYQRHATTPADRLRAAAIAVLVSTGFRIGELVTLPLDCEVREQQDSVERHGIRYYREKARGGGVALTVRWLSPLQAELACAAITEVRVITATAREQARRLERDPHGLAVTGLRPGALLRVEDVVRILGRSTKGSAYRIPRSRLRRKRVGHTLWYRAEDVQAYLRTERRQLWTVDRRDGTHQMLSESLFVVPTNFFHAQKTDSPVLVEPVIGQQINDFLSGRGVSCSAFERFDIRERYGRICRMTTHQVRHWLNTVAHRGGLPRDVLTQWMGRDRPADTDAYLHLTADERLAWAREAMRTDQLGGRLAATYRQVAEDDRDVFLEGQVQAVHVTPYGLCVHDFAVEPCPYHLNCLRGCPDYVRTKGSERERAELVQLRRRTVAALDGARQAVASGRGVAEAWVRSHEELLEGVDRALAVDAERVS